MTATCAQLVPTWPTPLLEENVPLDRAPVTPVALVVEDDVFMRGLLAQVLEEEGFEVLTAPNGEVALQTLAGEGTVDLVLTDFRMPRVTGLELVQAIRDGGGETEVVLLTAFADESVERAAAALGASAVLPKPFELASLLRITRDLFPGRWRR